MIIEMIKGRLDINGARIAIDQEIELNRCLDVEAEMVQITFVVDRKAYSITVDFATLMKFMQREHSDEIERYMSL